MMDGKYGNLSRANVVRVTATDGNERMTISSFERNDIYAAIAILTKVNESIAPGLHT